MLMHKYDKETQEWLEKNLEQRARFSALLEKLTKDLNDCPFCGGDASLCINGNAVFVKCDNCGCKSHFIRIEYGGTEAITAVVNRWNERTFN